MRPVGYVNIGQLEHYSPEIGYVVGEVSLWGRGIGKEAVRQALEWVKTQGKEYCHTTVLKNNKRGIGILRSLGFVRRGEARKGEWRYEKLLNSKQ